MKDLNQKERLIAVLLSLAFGRVAWELAGMAAGQNDDVLLFAQCAVLAASALAFVWSYRWYQRGKPKKAWFE